uniref:Serine protease n=1 Tax=Oncorhynchus tshawytscha TaxID=74940 RepID=A0AAZ3Q105_ONCTS
NFSTLVSNNLNFRNDSTNVQRQLKQVTQFVWMKNDTFLVIVVDVYVVTHPLQTHQGKSLCNQPGTSSQSQDPHIKVRHLMTFCVETEGGQNIKTKAMKNPELRNKVKYVCVYGYKGERVKQALRRDGRFDKTVLKTGFVLSEPETSVDTEMSQLVDGLDGKSYQGRKGEMLIVKVKRIGPALSPQKPTTTDTVKTQLQENLKKPSDVQQFLREEFGKKTQSFQEVKKVKRLIELSASVCQVRIEGNAQGTGFLLFEKLILTNAHVVHQIYEPITNKLQQSVTVTFDFEDLDERTQQIPVSDPDITLVESASSATEGGVKKTDPCFIIQHGDRTQAVEKHVRENEEFLYVINNRYFEEKWDIGTHLPRDTEKITYDTCFFHGASGSPVFNEYCQLIAMHTAGYSYQGKRGKTQSVIEYAVGMTRDVFLNLTIFLSKCNEYFCVSGKMYGVKSTLFSLGI